MERKDKKGNHTLDVKEPTWYPDAALQGTVTFASSEGGIAATISSRLQVSSVVRREVDKGVLLKACTLLTISRSLLIEKKPVFSATALCMSPWYQWQHGNFGVPQPL